MSQFAQSGSALDDGQTSDGDRGFVGVNQRLQLNELEPGEVRESLNGRMEGYWKPRRGVAARTGSLVSGGSPLQLPFFLVGTSVDIIAASVAAGVVTLTTGAAHGLTGGSAFSTSGIGYTVGTNPNGSFIATTASSSTITYPLIGGAGSYTVSFDQKSEVILSLTKAITATSAGVLGSGQKFIDITISGHGFIVGAVGQANVQGIVNFDGSIDPNGDFLLTVINGNVLRYFVPDAFGTFTAANTGMLSNIPINDAANVNVRASCLFSDPNAGNAESVVLALDTKAILVELSDLNEYTTQDIEYPSGQSLSGDTDMIQAFDRVYLFRDGQQAFEWFPNGRQIESASQSGVVVTIFVRDHGLTTGDRITITGLTGGSPPSNGEFVVNPVTDKDFFTYTLTSINITGALVPDATGVLPLADGTIGGAPYWQSPSGGTIVQWSAADNFWIIIEPTFPGFASWQSDVTNLITTPSPVDATGWVPGISVIAPVATGTPTISLLNQTISPYGVADAVLKADFTKVPGGAYTQPQVFVSTTGSVSAGVVSLTVTGNTTIAAGDTIVVYETDIPTFSAISGQSFEVLSATTTNISFIAPVANLASITGSQQIEFGGRFSVGGGFIHQPAPPWGTYFQRRLWVPFYYAPGGTFLAPTYTDRKITDEITVSDILDSHTFDQIANQFRITGGTTDYLVAMQGFYDDKLVVLNRNSLHLISGTTGSLNDTKVTQLTNEVGCLAKRSVVMKGNQMLFLSDDGVYSVEFLNDYNLRGVDEPLSKNIQPYIDRINKNLSEFAVGVLFNNRYYLAVALDSAAGANNAVGNNTILIFNFLNKGWESIDTFNAGDFLIENLIVGSASERNSIYAVTSLGGLHELEALETTNDNLISTGATISAPITASLTTRGYSLGNLDRKRFTDGQVTMQCVNGGTGEYSVAFAAEDPDNNELIGTTTDFLDGVVLGTGSSPEDETGNIRFRLGGIRGYVGSLTLTRTIGSPKITSIKVTGSVTNRQIISQT